MRTQSHFAIEFASHVLGLCEPLTVTVSTSPLSRLQNDILNAKYDTGSTAWKGQSSERPVFY